jgi:pyridinium-3,5-biscarboxylic acid mononucleotide sulfurtransferase
MLSVDALAQDLAQRLEYSVRSIGPMVVAFSGGVDSSLVTFAAASFLPKSDVLAVTADSASFATGERDLCRRLARSWGVAWQTVATKELDDARYQANNGDRCYWCKSALMDRLTPIASQGSKAIVLGVNLDDLGDHRPGQDAAKQRGAAFPLVDAGFAKSDVRHLARAWGLDVWDRPAMPCLASRIPYGTEVKVNLLSRIDRAELALRRLGFVDVRVRHYGNTARIEVPAGQIADAAGHSAAITVALRAVGYEYVTLDLAGLRSGNLNDALTRT